MSSCANTPLLDPITAPASYSSLSSSSSSSSSFSSVSSSQASSSAPASNPDDLVPLDDIPPLSLETLDTPDEKAQGLDLVAASVAEMRPRAAAALATHPLCLAGYSLTLAAALRLAGDTPGTALALACGLTAACLLAVRHVTRGYTALAEDVSWPWLRSPDTGEEDLVIGARYGSNAEVVGALVLRLEPNPTGRRRGRNSNANMRGGRGIIRAWTAKPQYRNQGVGRDLLQRAVRATRERCGRDAEVGFAQQHANSTMLLPSIFNGRFRRDEVRATRALGDAISQWEVSKKRR